MKAAFGCNGNTIRLRSGLYLNLADPKPEQFTLADIAGGLSKICRFGGQIERFYSVAEHCWFCCRIARQDKLPLETQAALLLHDATEAFLGDMVKPLKIMLPEYKRLENLMESAIAEKFGIDFEREKQHIGEIDHGVLIAERNALFTRDAVKWTGEEEARRIEIFPNCWSSVVAEEAFINAAEKVGITALIST